MLPIFICDDMEGELQHFERVINEVIEKEKLHEMHVSCVTDTPYEIIERLKRNVRQAIYFLDIDLKQEINGIDLAVKIREYDKTGYIIMLTAYEMQTVVFKHKIWALDYISKGILKIDKEIKDCLLKIHNIYLTQHDTSNFIKIQIGKNIFSLLTEEIYCIKVSNTQKRKLKVYKYDSEIEFTMTLKKIEEQLNNDFLKCNRACIVNIGHIRNFEDNKIILDNGVSCVTSRRRIQQLKTKYMFFPK